MGEGEGASWKVLGSILATRASGCCQTSAWIKCVSRSGPPLTRPSSVPSLLPRLPAPPRPPRQALSDFCSEPNTFILNTTQFNIGTSSGNSTHVPPWRQHFPTYKTFHVAPDLTI